MPRRKYFLTFAQAQDQLYSTERNDPSEGHAGRAPEVGKAQGHRERCPAFRDAAEEAEESAELRTRTSGFQLLPACL